MVSETEQILCREFAETVQKNTDVQETMDRQLQTRWKQTEAKLRDVHIIQQRNERRLQLEAQTLRRPQDLEHKTFT